MLLVVGWDRDYYHHRIDYHFELKPDGKVWIHAVNTDVSIDKELLELGIAADDLVIGVVEPYELEKGEQVKTAV